MNNVRNTIDWYISVLGFEEGNYVEEWDWGVVEKDDIVIMLAKPNEHTPFTGSQFTGSFYINTNDVDGWWNKLKHSDQIYYGIEDFEYGMREFAIKDCNGFILQFGQDMLNEEGR